MKQQEPEVDVTLLLEGSYPFVRGGVSAWVHALIQGLPELRFSLVYLGAEQRAEDTVQYPVPVNVTALHCHYLMDAGQESKPTVTEGDAGFFADSAQLHAWMRKPTGRPEPRWIENVLLQSERPDGACAQDFFHSKAAWQQISESYLRNCPLSSFQAYFWSLRNMHAPLFRLARVARSIGPSRSYHAISTGYAGLLGAMLQQHTGCPLLLTEHGIYTKERTIELQSLHLREQQGLLTPPGNVGMAYADEAWVRMFEGMGRLTYAAADPIISLYEVNRQRQILDGAEPARTRVVPNGVDVERFVPLRAQRSQHIPPVLGLIGRVVPIKDIKTFIRSIGTLALLMPQVQGWLIGPEEEDPGYVRECKALVESLGLGAHIRFLGFQKIDDLMAQLGLVVLTSISEAFPLVIGESHASGIPVVATDVGACRDLIEGRDAEDRALGPAGAVVPIADPEALALAAFQLLNEPGRWRCAQQAGIQRVERYYRQSQVLDSYRSLYRSVGAA
ncbi:glycosyl transferase family 1 [Rhodoferax lacus]|uniref:Glycosyl transferase family 1 n=1 Tax=Rhodoferax lacus TaxID=2184758 RepID=A0A3E1R664_9BURK|nr:GT4 family glycosyltransferase PelF [Rhodoferax lacus]RFO94865.1 glycosyl transferase family 1 [Rhodoferax lacus]